MENNRNSSNGGFIEEKLYSPVFVRIRADENLDYYDDVDYYDDPLTQQSAACYYDEIHAAILKERLPNEIGRGLMEYYRSHGSNDTVDDKVYSLFVDVEIHDGRLWGVATLQLCGPLTDDEYLNLKGYLSGQYSDGFGEGFEQRAIKTRDGELYVGLWDSGGDFFIDRQAAFARRTGLNYIMSGQSSHTHGMAITEQAQSTTEISGLRQQLLARAFINWFDFRHAPHTSTPGNLYSHAVEVVGRRNAHDFIKNYKGFTEEQLKCLLQFESPVELIGDYLDPASDISDMPGILENIMEEQENFKEYYAPVPDPNVPSFAEKEFRLQMNFEENFTAYKRDIMVLSKDEIFDSASEIALVCESFDYFSKEHGFVEPEVDFLLKFQNPLELVSDKWGIGQGNLTYILSVIFDNQDSILESCGYKLAEAKPSEKPSVIAQIREAQQAARDKPDLPKEPQLRKKSETEL